MRVLIFFFLSALPAFSQINYENMIKQARVVAEATQRFDFATVADHTHPSLLEMAGGKEGLIALAEMSLAEMKEDGTSIDSLMILTPSDTALAGDEIHCIIPTKLYMTIGDTRVISNSALLAASSDGGQSWKFMDLNSMTNESIRTIFPDFNSKLKIPTFGFPEIIYPEEEERQD